METENFLASLEQQITEWAAVASSLKEQLYDLQRGQEELRTQLAMLGHRSEKTGGFLSVSDAYSELGYETPEALRRAIRAGHFRSGTEAVKLHGDSGPWRLDVAAIRSRLQKEQQLRRVC